MKQESEPEAGKEDVLHVPLMGGLGNQTFQAVHALYWLMEDLRNRRVFIYGETHIWRDLLKIDLDTLSREINLVSKIEFPMLTRKLVGIRLRCSPRLNEFPVKLVACLAELLLRFRISKQMAIKTVFFSENLGYEEIPIFNGNAIIFGYFQTHVFWNELKTKMALRKAEITQSHSCTENVTRGEGEKLVIHVRLGDYLSEKDFGNLGWSYYREALKFVHQERSISKVMIFSDEIEKAIAKYEILFNDLFGSINVNLKSESILWFGAADLDNIQTIELMKSGSVFILANSSFSWWAASLSPSEQSLVICPSPWFAKLEEPRKLIPSDWVRVPSNFRESKSDDKL
jgi:hypothetical protein